TVSPAAGKGPKGNGKAPYTVVSDAGDVTSHIAGVYNGTRMLLFVNGRRADLTKDEDVTPLQHYATLSFGGKFKGTISAVRISQAACYKDDFTPQKRFDTDADTLGLFHFEEGQGDWLIDSSGRDNHGKIDGAKWVNFDGTPIDPNAVPPPKPPVADAGP